MAVRQICCEKGNEDIQLAKKNQHPHTLLAGGGEKMSNIRVRKLTHYPVPPLGPMLQKDAQVRPKATHFADQSTPNSYPHSCLTYGRGGRGVWHTVHLYIFTRACLMCFTCFLPTQIIAINSLQVLTTQFSFTFYS